MTDHTPEPWQAIGGRKDRAIIGSKRSIARVWGAIQPDDRPGHEEADANAARIVACVNACAGIPTERLERGGVADLVLVLQGILDEPDNDMTLDSLEAARDALAPFRKD